MRLIGAIGFVLLAWICGFAQVVAGGAGFEQSQTVVDSSGNLVVLDFVRTTPSVAVAGLDRTFFASQTRVTIQRPGSTRNVETVQYPAALQIIGQGDAAVYAIATLYVGSNDSTSATRTLIAIRLDQTLPGTVSGFPSLALAPQVEVKVGPSDYISLITPALRPTGFVSVPLTPRTARVVRFVNGTFESISSGNLP